MQQLAAEFGMVELTEVFIQECGYPPTWMPSLPEVLQVQKILENRKQKR